MAGFGKNMRRWAPVVSACVGFCALVIGTAVFVTQNFGAAAKTLIGLAIGITSGQFLLNLRLI